MSAREELPVGALPTDRPYVQRPGIVAPVIDETPAEWRPVESMTTTMLIITRDDARQTATRRAAAAVELGRRLAECSAALGLTR